MVLIDCIEILGLLLGKKAREIVFMKFKSSSSNLFGSLYRQVHIVINFHGIVKVVIIIKISSTMYIHLKLL